MIENLESPVVLTGQLVPTMNRHMPLCSLFRDKIFVVNHGHASMAFLSSPRFAAPYRFVLIVQFSGCLFSWKGVWVSLPVESSTISILIHSFHPETIRCSSFLTSASVCDCKAPALISLCGFHLVNFLLLLWTKEGHCICLPIHTPAADSRL